jgi:hypothetical protein
MAHTQGSNAVRVAAGVQAAMMAGAAAALLGAASAVIRPSGRAKEAHR